MDVQQGFEANRDEETGMESNTTARRTEDIALDLLKFVASHANVGNKAAGSTGFGIPSAAKADDQVTHLLELYARCREAVEGPISRWRGRTGCRLTNEVGETAGSGGGCGGIRAEPSAGVSRARTLGQAVELAAVVEPDAKAREAAAAAFGVRGFANVAECVAAAEAEGWRLDAASVCVPTVHHRVVAEQLLLAGIDVLIEKPLAASLEDADAILAPAARCGRVVQVGHLERFNPAVTAVRGLLNRPMFFEAHRLSIFTLRSLDVDVVLDLMIHDLDIVLSLVGSQVREVRAVGLPVLSPKVDIANVRLEFENGCMANFTASGCRRNGCGSCGSFSRGSMCRLILRGRICW